MAVPDDDPADVDRGLHDAMRRAEAELAEDLGRSGYFVVADGPLYEYTAVPKVGYVKSHRRSYLPDDRAAIIGDLPAGYRTPLFTVGEGRFRRYSWYLRLVDRARGHSWTGIVRCEASAALDRGRSRHHRRSHRGGAPRCRFRGASRSARSAEPGAHRRPGARPAASARRRRPGAAGAADGSGGGGMSRGPGGRESAHHDPGVPGDPRRGPVPPIGRSRGGAHRGARRGQVATYGVVTEVEAVYEGASFESDTVRIADDGRSPPPRCARPRWR